MTNRIAFVDSRVTDYQTLIDGLPTDTEVIVLNADQDGVMQIIAALQGKNGLDAIDIFSHGSSGAITLGSAVLNSNSLPGYAAKLAEIGTHLTESGDILLYGCDVAQGDMGQAFIGQLAQLTGADVAASNDLTGATALGGDWVLEAQKGEIESKSVFSAETAANYDNVLTSGFVGSFAFSNWVAALNSGSVTTSGTSNVTVISGNSNYSATTTYQISIPIKTTISFNWNYSTNDWNAYSIESEFSI